MRPIAAVSVALLLFACETLEDITGLDLNGFEAHGVTRWDPPPEYRDVWAEIVALSGSTKDYDFIDWKLADRIVLTGGEEAFEILDSTEANIYLLRSLGPLGRAHYARHALCHYALPRWKGRRAHDLPDFVACALGE